MEESKEIMWSINIKSSANKEGLSNPELEDAILSVKSDYCISTKNDFYDRGIEEYKGTVGEW